MTHSIGSLALAGNPDDAFDQIVSTYEDDTHWGASVNLSRDELRPEEVERQNAFLAAVPGSKPWTSFVQLYVNEDGLISMTRMDNPENGWVLTPEENDALMAAQQEAGRRARSNTPAPPDAA